MNNNLPLRWTAALCVLLAACSSTDSNRMSATDSSNTQDGSTSSYGNTGSSTAATAPTAGSTTTMAQTAYGVVQTIEQVTRQDVGLGAVGAAAAGGTMGSPTEKVYRVKVKLDDGSEQVVVVDTMPTYQVGDRIRYSNGTLQRY
jgi:hypothetical protein